MEWFWGHYLADDADRVNPYACPAYAKTLKGLPPAMVMTAEYDPLRDEGEAYAARLREEGVTTVLKRYDGVTHGFFGMPSVLDKSKRRSPMRVPHCGSRSGDDPLHRHWS
jgi:acetyl esterase